MKTYFQSLSQKYNLIYNLLIATIISGVFSILSSLEATTNLITNNLIISTIFLIVLLVIQIITYLKYSQLKEINKFDILSLNTIISSLFVMIYIFMESIFTKGGIIMLSYQGLSFLFNLIAVIIKCKNITIDNNIGEAIIEKQQNIIPNNENIPENVEEIPLKSLTEEDLDEEVVIEKNNLLTEAIEINAQEYNTFLMVLKEFMKDNNLSVSQINSLRNKNILMTLFSSFKSPDELKNYLNNCQETILNKSSIGLQITEIISLNYLFINYPDLRNEILNNIDYYISNNSHSYLFRLKQLQTKQFENMRRNYFENLFNKYNDFKVKNILSSIYQEVNDYLNDRIQKKTIKLEQGSAQSLAYYDLYLFEYNFDYAKARRQVTKFIEEYNKSQTQSDYSKCYKEFLDDVFKTDYAPTIFPYLSTLISRVSNKEKLLIDIYKKLSFYQTKEQFAINNLNKVINSLVIILNQLGMEESIKQLNQLYAKIDDLIFLDKLYNSIIESYGYSNDITILTEELLKNKLIEFIVRHNDYFLSKDLNKNEFLVLNTYLKNEEIFKDFISKNLNDETLLQVIVLFTISNKVKNITHYDLDLKSLTQFISKSEILKILKQKEESAKITALTELVKNKSIDTRLNLDPKKIN